MIPKGLETFGGRGRRNKTIGKGKKKKNLNFINRDI
jgi:hypothetical protein